MAQEAVSQRYAPAYVTSSTFFAFLDEVANDGLPHHIDRSLLPRMSGATQAHLLSSLKFLNLIEEDGEVTSAMKALVDAKKSGADQFKSALIELISTSYAGVLDGAVVEKLTPRQLADKFRAAGADGSTLQKAIRFYLKALTECGIPYPKVLNRTASVSSGGPKKKSNGGSTAKESDDGAAGSKSNKLDEKKSKATLSIDGLLPIPLPTVKDLHRAAYLPIDITLADCDTLEVISRAIAERMEASQLDAGE